MEQRWGCNGIVMKTIITILLLCLTTTLYASQPVGHMVAGKFAWDHAPQHFKLLWMDVDLRAPAAMLSHVAIDRLVGEAVLGEYQTDISVVRMFTLYFAGDDAEREQFLAAAFWSLFPDLIDKHVTPFMHTEGVGSVFNLNRDQTELLEEILLFFHVINL